MIDPSIESVPDQEKAAYLLENGDSLMVWNGESGWEYEFFDTSLEPVIGHRARGVTSLSEAMHLAMEQMNYTGLSFTAQDCDEFFALVKRSLETGYSPIVFPFLDKEQVIINDVSVEPVVTITETTIYQLRSRMELPLHIADKLFAQLEQEQISQHGKREKKQCPAVRFRINYRIGGKDGVYQGVFYTGSGNGGLLLHMERAANRRQYYLQKHPEQGDLDACGYILNTMIPAFYQQSIRAENRVMNKVLPPPVPLLNVTHDEAVNDPAISSQAFYASHRETVRCARAMDEGLERAFHHRAAYQFLDGMNREFGTERVKIVLARTVQLKDYDGRINQENKAYAAAIPVRNASESIDEDMTRSYNLNVHPVVIDGAVTAFRKMEHTRHAPNRQRQDAAHSKSAGNRAKRLER